MRPRLLLTNILAENSYVFNVIYFVLAKNSAFIVNCYDSDDAELTKGNQCPEGGYKFPAEDSLNNFRTTRYMFNRA
jgi:hypothetical protein